MNRVDPKPDRRLWRVTWTEDGGKHRIIQAFATSEAAEAFAATVDGYVDRTAW